MTTIKPDLLGVCPLSARDDEIDDSKAAGDGSNNVIVDTFQSAFLSELVGGLIKTRDELGIHRMMRAWAARVRAARHDPDQLIDLFRNAPTQRRGERGNDPAWAHADKREFVLACIDVHSRSRSS